MRYSESPFEFRALEVALETICSFLAARTTELESEAYPALDDLTTKVLITLFFMHFLYFLLDDVNNSLSVSLILRKLIILLICSLCDWLIAYP